MFNLKKKISLLIICFSIGFNNFIATATKNILKIEKNLQDKFIDNLVNDYGKTGAAIKLPKFQKTFKQIAEYFNFDKTNTINMKDDIKSIFDIKDDFMEWFALIYNINTIIGGDANNDIENGLKNPIEILGFEARLKSALILDFVRKIFTDENSNNFTATDLPNILKHSKVLNINNQTIKLKFDGNNLVIQNSNITKNIDFKNFFKELIKKNTKSKKFFNNRINDQIEIDSAQAQDIGNRLGEYFNKIFEVSSLNTFLRKQIQDSDTFIFGNLLKDINDKIINDIDIKNLIDKVQLEEINILFDNLLNTIKTATSGKISTLIDFVIFLNDKNVLMNITTAYKNGTSVLGEIDLTNSKNTEWGIRNPQLISKFYPILLDELMEDDLRKENHQLKQDKAQLQQDINSKSQDIINKDQQISTLQTQLTNIQQQGGQPPIQTPTPVQFPTIAQTIDINKLSDNLDGISEVFNDLAQNEIDPNKKKKYEEQIEILKQVGKDMTAQAQTAENLQQNFTAKEKEIITITKNLQESQDELKKTKESLEHEKKIKKWYTCVALLGPTSFIGYLIKNNLKKNQQQSNQKNIKNLEAQGLNKTLQQDDQQGELIN